MARHGKNHRGVIQFGAFSIATLLTVSLIAGSQASSASEPIDLGSAANFAVLAGSGITNTGATTISGTGLDLGSHPTFSFTGEHEIITAGTKYLVAHDSVRTAKVDLLAAYSHAKGLSGGTTIVSGTRTLDPGLYKTAAIFSLAAAEVLTLDAQGDADAIFIFQIGSSLTLAANSEIVLSNGAQAKNVYWQVGSAATFAAYSKFQGTVMAQSAITAAEGASFQGQLLAITASVTLSNNSITNNSASQPQSQSQAPTVATTASPSGTPVIGSILTNATTFSGSPSPTLGYSWEFSEDGESDWTAIDAGGEPTLTLTDSHLGGYLRTVVTATNTSGTLAQTSTASGQVLPTAPAVPVLVSSSDTGSSSSDGVTQDTSPELALSGLVVAAEVIVTASKDTQQTCSFTASETTGGCVITDQLNDGVWSITATNVVSGYASSDSNPVFITIDTTTPEVSKFTVNQDSFSANTLTHSLLFTENVTGLLASDIEIVSADVSCDAPTISGSGSSYTVSLIGCSDDDLVQLRLKADAVLDQAGNAGPVAPYLTDVAIRDQTAPTVSNVSSTTPDGMFVYEDQIRIQVQFSEAVVVTGTPTIELDAGADRDQVVDYVSGSGTNKLVFVYTVQRADTAAELHYAATTSLSSNSGTIQDAAGNDAVLTLSSPGATESLAANKSFEVDGETLRLELSTSNSKSNNADVTWVLEAPAAIDCSTLSMVEGNDFDFVGLKSIDRITASSDNLTCTIEATSSVPRAQYGTSSITPASSFSLIGSLGNTQDLVVTDGGKIVVTMAAAAPNLGGNTVTTKAGTRPAVYKDSLDEGLFPGVETSTRNSLNTLGLVTAPIEAPQKTEAVDHSGIDDPAQVLNSKSQLEIEGGDSVSLSVKVGPSIASNHKSAAYVFTGETWVYAGTQEFIDEEAITSRFSLTESGSYFFRFFVVPDELEIRTLSPNLSPNLSPTMSPTMGFGVFSNPLVPVISTMSIPASGLPTVNQSYEVEIIVTNSVATSSATPSETPAPGSSGSGYPSGSSSGSSSESTTDDTENAEVDEKAEVDESKPKAPDASTGDSKDTNSETAPGPDPKIELSEQPENEQSETTEARDTDKETVVDPDNALPGDYERIDKSLVARTFEQMPGTVRREWELPVDIGMSFAVLGTFWFISRRRKSKANQREELF